MKTRSNPLLGLLAALLLVVAACGDASSGTTAPELPSLTAEPAATQADGTTTTVPVDPQDAFGEYAACMREHGIDLPDPDTSGGGGVIDLGGDDLDLEAFEAAGAECDPILEAAIGEFELSPEEEAEMMDQELALAQCMRDNGIDWPDPTGDRVSAIELGDDVDPESVNAAMETCSKEVFGDAGGVFISGGSVEATP